MKDYIERDELVSYFKEIATKTLRDGSVQCVLGAGVIAHMIVEIKEFPAADVRPVVRGRWMTKEYMYGDPEAGLEDMWVDRPAEETDDYAYCSVCDKDAEYTGEAELVLSDFCPNCGADMRRESE